MSSEQPPASTTTTAISTPPTMVSSEKFDNATAFFPTSRPPPKWMLPQPSLPISQPVKSAKYNASGGVPGSQNTTDSDSSDDQSTSHTVSLREIIFTKFFVKMILRKKSTCQCTVCLKGQNLFF